MPQNQTDAQALRDSMTREVSNDAYAISSQIFKGQESDVARVSNDQVDARYRQAFASGDRQYLMQEAARDPVQFLASMDRLGVTMPPGQQLPQEPKLPSSAKPNVPVPKPPESALQQMYPSPESVPAPPPPTPPMPPPAPALPPAPPLAAAPAAPPMPPPDVIPPAAQPPY